MTSVLVNLLYRYYAILGSLKAETETSRWVSPVYLVYGREGVVVRFRTVRQGRSLTELVSDVCNWSSDLLGIL